MGAVVANIELENAVDRGMSARGSRDESTVRRTRVDGIVDTGAVTLVLPQNVVEWLGLATHRHRHLRRREEGRAPCRRARDRADRRPFHEYGCDRRAAALGAVDRPGDPRGPGPDRRPRQAGVVSPGTRLSVVEPEAPARGVPENRAGRSVYAAAPTRRRSSSRVSAVSGVSGRRGSSSRHAMTAIPLAIRARVAGSLCGRWRASDSGSFRYCSISC